MSCHCIRLNPEYIWHSIPSCSFHRQFHMWWVYLAWQKISLIEHPASVTWWKFSFIYFFLLCLGIVLWAWIGMLEFEIFFGFDCITQTNDFLCRSYLHTLFALFVSDIAISTLQYNLYKIIVCDTQINNVLVRSFILFMDVLQYRNKFSEGIKDVKS